MLGHPGKQGREARAVVADLQSGDRCSGGIRDLCLVGVTMGVDTDDGIDDSAKLGTGLILPGRWSWSAPAWMGSPSGISVMGHAIGGQASDQANLVG
jgi:hypothetical protein